MIEVREEKKPSIYLPGLSFVFFYQLQPACMPKPLH